MKQTKKLVMAALFAALACVCTMSIRIPTPGTNGYIHPGDAVVILCGIFLDPKSAFLAAGLGSGMADLLGGYFIYVPITFAIKGLVALSAHFCFNTLGAKCTSFWPGLLAAGVSAMVLVAGGYFICESFIYGPAAAAASVPANLIQGGGGMLIASALFPLLRAVPDIRRMFALQ